MSNTSISQKNELHLRNELSQAYIDKINQRYSPKIEENSSFYSNLRIDKYMKKNSLPNNKENRDMTNISFNPYESILSNNFQYQNEDPFNTNIENIECNNSKFGPLFSENSFDLDLLKSQRNSANPNDRKQKLRSFGSDREIKDLREKDSYIIDNSNLEVKIIDENSNLEEEKNINLMSKRKISNLFNNINYGHIQEVNEEDEEDKKSVMTFSQIKKAVTSFRFWRLFIITITRGPISLLLHSTLRNIATVEVYQESVTTTLIQNIATIRPIINAFLNPLLGLLSDRFKYKYFLIFIHLSYIIFGISYPFILKNNILVYIWILYFTIPHAMILIATPPHFMKIFGMKHYIEVSGIYSFSTIINSTISSVFAFTIENIFKNDMEKGYKLMFISSGLLCIVSFFLGLSEEETPFDYSD